ncbi:STAS domain-containing protein [Georgenia sp. TF02-10]|uniref:STAS domain-containing protein n=1 Tax=Georgenia sp. TF02-10 TaxID=2917725 RepID=UPI001FA70D71|nr:STAS domain-containing protein [Georgenia sp. TF02-10]UNX54899.1 STAS domain-containing protein [Georgenia sp. TF02-10]
MTPATADGEGSVAVLVAPDRVRLVLAGEVDSLLAAELATAVRDAAARRQPVEVDTRNVTFMDSTGVATLAELSRRTSVRPAFIRPPELVRFLLEVTGLGRVVDILEDDPGFPSPGDPANGVLRG